ncbi:hypothetical protein ACJX0J_016161 [Zea mays]
MPLGDPFGRIGDKLHYHCHIGSVEDDQVTCAKVSSKIRHYLPGHQQGNSSHMVYIVGSIIYLIHISFNIFSLYFSFAFRATIANMSPEYGATMGFFPTTLLPYPFHHSDIKVVYIALNVIQVPQKVDISMIFPYNFLLKNNVRAS